MPATVVLGAQWGDEGKGKVTDVFAESADLVVRYQGGNNAGHTIMIGEQRFALSLIPSGVMYPHATPVIASGTVIDPKVLLAEIDMLIERGIDPSRLRISSNAHLIMPYHRKLDAVMERYLGKNLIGYFHMPALVLIDPAFLRTLPSREIFGGMAEVVKYGAGLDAGFFDWLEANRGGLLDREAGGVPERFALGTERGAPVRAIRSVAIRLGAIRSSLTRLINGSTWATRSNYGSSRAATPSPTASATS